MKKYIKITISIFVILLGVITVRAAANNIAINTSSSKVVVGNKVTYTVKLTSSKSLISLQYGITYDQSKLTLVSGNVNYVDIFTGPRTTATYTFVFRARASGSANFKFSARGAAYSSDEEVVLPTTSKTISIITQSQLEATYSKNNNLSSLGVTGYKLTPTFNSNTLVYNLEVENNIREVVVTGSRADNRSTVKGLGKYKLEEGINKITVTVTAQNGLSKKYTININVKELEPINVELDGKNYTVVRKANLLTKPNDLFVGTILKINELEVPAFINELSDITLVGLKDSENNIETYEYKDAKYFKYSEIKFPELITVFKELDKIPEGYKKSNITINEKEYVVYEKDENILINLLNLKTGKENLYKYEKEEGTIQLFNLAEKPKELNEKKTNYIYIYVTIVLSGILLTTYSILIFNNFKRKSLKKKKKTEKSGKIKEDIDKKKK